MFLRKYLKPILRTIAGIVFRVQTKELDKINDYLKENPKNIFVCNHLSFLDGLILGLFLPCDPVFLVHTTILQRPLFKFLLGFVDYLSIEPASPMALKSLANAVNQGRPVVIFPEGRITVTGGLMKVYEGSAFVAGKTQANIIPITLLGLLKSNTSRMGVTYPKTLFPKISIIAHKPVQILMNPELRPKERRKDAGEQLRKILQLTAFEATPTDQTIYKSFVQSSYYYGEKHVIIEDLDRSEITYKKLNIMAQGIGYFLSKLTSKGQYVGILLPNTPICAATFLG